ncbi:KIF9 protein, partial [Halcyon senegalensis]|nr:KIF9 protein [Halcyon senegalensis]
MDAGEKRVRAFVRVKPTADFAQDMIKFGPDNKSIDVSVPKDAKQGVVNNRPTEWSFRLDGVLHHASQDLAYNTVAKELVAQALTGYNGTIMCYGQTGAGKTYTMTGTTAEYRHRGIVPRVIQQVFQTMAHSLEPSVAVRVSYLEIYNETLVDLLSPARSGEGPMVVVDSPRGVYVKGLSLHSVCREEEALNLLFEARKYLIVIAEHTLNKSSSRSHCIFTVYIESHFRLCSDVKRVSSKINLIDLAGSERLSKTGSEGQVLKEATYINKSLSFLEQIVIALADPKRDHIPFRQSKLTHVLKDSLGGNCNTVLVANICGEAVHVEETLSSLRFATRMKWITAEPVLNETYDQEGTVKALEKEIRLLKQELAVHDSLANRSGVSYDPLTANQIVEIKSQVQRYLNGATDEIDVSPENCFTWNVFEELMSKRALSSPRQQECQVEAGFRSKYLLVDKNDFAAVAALQKVTRTCNMVGFQFLIMMDLISLVHLFPLVRKEGNRSSLSGRDLDFLPKTQSVISTKDLVMKEEARNQGPAEADADVSKSPPVEDTQRPSSPPSKLAAFEQFKEQCGSEISRIFKENKSILHARRKRSSSVAQRINSIKHEMEDIQKALEAQKQERWQQGEYVDEKGQLIIDEEEFLLLTKLKDLKEEYRSGYAELQDLKAEIQYCQHLVDQCRKKLVSEFEIWYSESFLIPRDLREALKPGGNIRPGMIPINRVTCLEEDEQDRFERLQETTLPACPASASFYRARMKTEQKHSYARTLSSLQQMKKKPGLVTAAGKNKPLSFLHIT